MDQEEYDGTSTNGSENNNPTPTATLSIASESIPLRKKETSQDDFNARSISVVQAVENRPIENTPLLIRTRKEPHLYLAICDGQLELLSKLVPSNGNFWYCARKGAWYGFRNTVTGCYIGMGYNTICQMGSHHTSMGYFTTERDMNGGYIMNIFMPENKLLPLSIEEIDGKKNLSPKDGTGTAWDFIDIKYVNSSVTLAHPDLGPERLQ
ncbi:hypothetical protein ACQKWADRAFT_285994 [Trichoderma austrokoningii]